MTTAHDFTVKTIQGNPKKLADYKDQVDDRVNLGGRSSARTPNLLGPPFRAPCAS
jgi:hypothetical protein